MRRPFLPGAFLTAMLLGLVVAAPASAAVTGTICGQVTAFLAPTATTDGSITIEGRTEIIDMTAFGAIDLGTLTTLTTVANADATTCLDVTADGAGEITDIAVAAQARICGTATLNATTGTHAIGGVDLPTSLVTAGSSLDAFLDAAAAGGASVCADVTVDPTTGLFTTVRLDATITLCGDAVLDADSATLGGIDVPFTLLDAEAEAALALSAATGADVCVTIVVDDTRLVQANLTASVDLCGDVTLAADGSAVVDGTAVPSALLSAEAAALLRVAAEADGTACVAIDATSTAGDTTVSAIVTIDVCLEVTAVTSGTVTLGGVTFLFPGAASAGIEVGDEICVDAATGATGGPVITQFGGVLAGAAAPAPPPAMVMLPNTATDGGTMPAALGALLLIGAGIGVSSMRRLVIDAR